MAEADSHRAVVTVVAIAAVLEAVSPLTRLTTALVLHQTRTDLDVSTRFGGVLY